MSGVFGVRGEVRLHLHNRDDSVLFDGAPVVLIAEDGTRTETRCKARPGAGKRIIGDLGLSNPDEARAMMGQRLVIKQDDLPELPDDSFYVWQVEGLPVYVDDAQRGVVVTVHSTAGGDVLEIELDGETAFVPMPFVQLDLDGGRVDIDAEVLD